MSTLNAGNSGNPENSAGSESTNDNTVLSADKDKGNDGSSTNDNKEEAGKENVEGQADSESQKDNPQKDEVQIGKIELPESYSEEERATMEKFASELKPSPEQAKVMSNYLTQMQEAEASRFQTMKAGWESELKADKEFGGDKFEENVAYAKAGLNAFDESGEMLTLLEKFGYGSNPLVVKHFARLGRMMDDDKLVIGSSGGNDTRTLAQKLYK